MSEKSKSFTKAFKWSGTEQKKTVKLAMVFVLGHFLFWLACFLGSPKEPPLKPPGQTRSHFTDPLFVSLPIKLLGILNPSGATRMSLKHETKGTLIPEVYIHKIQLETPNSGVAQVEIRSQDLKQIIAAGEYQPFLAFPWNPQSLKQPKEHPPYEIHLD